MYVLTPIKHFDAQPLDEYEKQLPREENRKSGYVRQLLMTVDSFVSCIYNTKSERYLVLSDLLVA